MPLTLARESTGPTPTRPRPRPDPDPTRTEQARGGAVRGGRCGGGAAKRVVHIADHARGKLRVLTEAVVGMFGARLPAQALVPLPVLPVPGMPLPVLLLPVLHMPALAVPGMRLKGGRWWRWGDGG